MNWYTRFLSKLAAKGSIDPYGYWVDPKGAHIPVEETQYDEMRNVVNPDETHLGKAKKMGFGTDYASAMLNGYMRLVTNISRGDWGVEFEKWPSRQQANRVISLFEPYMKYALRNNKSMNVQVPGYSITLHDLNYLPQILLDRKIPRDRQIADVMAVSLEQKYPDYRQLTQKGIQ